MPEIDAFKQAMRGGVPVDQWRPPKPEATGAPGGIRGGKGTNIAALAGADIAFEAAVAARDRAKESLAAAERAANQGGLEALGGLIQGHMAYEQAEAQVRALALGQVGMFSGAGSQAAQRSAEERDRQYAAAMRVTERELEKEETRPNYREWSYGRDAMQLSQSVRGTAHDVSAGAGRLRGKVDDETVKAVKDASDSAKKAAKDAEKAGKKAKDAAKYGTKAEAEAAAEKAREAAKKADKAGVDAEEALANANAKAKAEKGQDKDGASDGEGAPPSSKPVPHASNIWPDCGNPLELCECNLACTGLEKCVCIFVPGAVIGGPKVVARGVKGRGMPAREFPSDGGNILYGFSGAMLPSDGGILLSPLLGPQEAPGEPAEEDAAGESVEVRAESLEEAAGKSLAAIAQQVAEASAALSALKAGAFRLLERFVAERSLSKGDETQLSNIVEQLQIRTSQLSQLDLLALAVRAIATPESVGAPAHLPQRLAAIGDLMDAARRVGAGAEVSIRMSERLLAEEAIADAQNRDARSDPEERANLMREFAAGRLERPDAGELFRDVVLPGVPLVADVVGRVLEFPFTWAVDAADAFDKFTYSLVQGDSWEEARAAGGQARRRTAALLRTPIGEDMEPQTQGKALLSGLLAAASTAVGGAVGRILGTVGGRGSEPGAIAALGSRRFTSRDPLVGGVANEIEALYPGHVKFVNYTKVDPVTGRRLAEFDIVLGNAVIEVKSGVARHLVRDMREKLLHTDLPVIGYAPDIPEVALRAVRRAGLLVTRDKDDLLIVVRPP